MAAEVRCPTITADSEIVILEGDTVVLGVESRLLGCPACMEMEWVDTEALAGMAIIQWAVVMQKTGKIGIHAH